jgi:ParB family chromosome partitioning protein
MNLSLKPLDFLIPIIYIIENNSERRFAMDKNTNGTKEQSNEKAHVCQEIREIEGNQSSQESLNEGATLIEKNEITSATLEAIKRNIAMNSDIKPKLLKKKAMGKNRHTDINVISTSAKKNTILSIAPNKLVPFDGHPFKLYEGQRLQDMVESIRANGILAPVIVRPHNKEKGKYEILSGHNRVKAAKEAGLKEVPIIIRENLTDEDALLIVTETNLIQRSFADLQHSERAVALATHYEAMKKKPGYRSDLLQEIEEITSAPVGRRLGTRDKLGEQYGLGKNTVARYLRVNKLITTLKDRLDNGKIGMRVAEALSYLKEEEQEIVDRLLAKGNKISIKQADTLKEKSGNGGLNETSINEIFDPGYFDVKVKPVKLSGQFLSQHFKPEQSAEEIEKVIAKALEQYFMNRSN